MRRISRLSVEEPTKSEYVGTRPALESRSGTEEVTDHLSPAARIAEQAAMEHIRQRDKDEVTELEGVRQSDTATAWNEAPD